MTRSHLIVRKPLQSRRPTLRLTTAAGSGELINSPDLITASAVAPAAWRYSPIAVIAATASHLDFSVPSVTVTQV
jgi:hypothetical protein